MAAGSGITLRNSAEADIPTPGSGQVTIFNDSDASNTPAFKDSTAVVTSLRGPTGATGATGATGPAGAGVPPTVFDHGTLGATSEPFHYADGPAHTAVLGAILTMTLTGATTGEETILTLYLFEDGTGGHINSTVWDTGIVWPGGTPPTFNAAANALNVIPLVSIDGGTVWEALVTPAVTDIESLVTTETNTALVYAPNGTGGVTARAETGGSGAGTELDYVATTSATSLTASSEATANTIVTGSSITYDGSTIVFVEVYLSQIYSDNVAGIDLFIALYEDGSSIGWAQGVRSETTNRGDVSFFLKRRLTPSAGAHTFSARGWTTGSGGSAGGGPGGSGFQIPGYIRVVKV